MSWLNLYKQTVSCYKELRGSSQSDNPTSPSKQEIRFIWNLLMTLQTKLHALDLEVPIAAKYILNEGKRLFHKNFQTNVKTEKKDVLIYYLDLGSNGINYLGRLRLMGSFHHPLKALAYPPIRAPPQSFTHPCLT